MNRTIKFLLVAFAITWIFVVTFSYYIVHKPFSVENALAILNALGDVLVAGTLVALAAALGRRGLRVVQFASPLEALIFQTGAGLGLIALATFLLGLVLVNRFVFCFLLIVVAFLLRGDLQSVWHDLSALRLPVPSRFERTLAVFVALALTIGGLVALLPPTAWDAQTYHLVIPKIALERGHIGAPPDIVYFNFPSLGEMLFLAAMLLKGDVAAQVLHFSYFSLTLGAVFGFALRYFNVRVAWLAVAVLVAVPSLLVVSTWAYVDLMLAFYAFASFYALMLALERNGAQWFALSGVFAGFAVSLKYTAAIVPVGLVILIVLHRLNLKYLFWFVAMCGLMAAPYYIRNWVFTGNPVYPFVFGGRYWDTFRAEWFSRFGTGLLNSPVQLLLAPWDATIGGSEGAAGYEATIGPLLLMLVPLLLFVNSKFKIQNSDSAIRHTPYAIRDLVFFAVFFYFFWLCGIAGSKLLLQTRLLFPVFPALALMAALALEHLDALDLPQFSAQRFVQLVMLLVFGLAALSYALGFASSSSLAYLTGVESRDVYLTKQLDGYYAAVKFISTDLPKDARVFFLWEPRSYYADRVTQPDAILDAWVHLRWQYRDADSIAAALRERGYTHVLLNRQGFNLMLITQYDSISAEDARVLQTMLAQRARVIYGEALQVTEQSVPRAEAVSYAIYELTR